MSKILRRIIKDKGSRARASEWFKKRGVKFHPARFQRILEGKNAPSLKMAVEIEHATCGKIQAMDVVKESFPWWRKHLGLNAYNRVGKIMNHEEKTE